MIPGSFLSIENAISDFVNEEPPRGVALETLRGPALKISVNGDSPFPAASVAKLPLAVAIYEEAAAGRLALHERVSREKIGRTAYPSILAVFSKDHSFTLEELCGLMLATSDNPTSQYLLERVGLHSVNLEAQRLGARNTRIMVGFQDEMLGETGRANVTTPDDALSMLKAMAARPSCQGLMVALKNNLRNFRLPLRLPDTIPVAHKTGSLLGVAIDAGIIYGGNVDLAVSFLSDHQLDTARTGLAIGDCMGRIWGALGEDLGTG
jgi:beta-lactamase class A